MKSDRNLLRLFAELLEYPDESVSARARQCRDLLAGEDRSCLENRCPGPTLEAATLMEDFRSFAESSSPGRLEELYTATFDLSPECCPYVGYQLFGENPKRGALMVKLQECYRESGYQMGNELPDHLAVLLRFLAELHDPEFERDLAKEIVAPALQKMAGSLAEKNGYGKVIRAAAIVMSDE